jgi:hypothetical protein
VWLSVTGKRSAIQERRSGDVSADPHSKALAPPFADPTGGDAALYYDPGDAPSGWRTLSRALDSNVRARLGDNARAQIKNFPGNWKTYAERFIELVDAVGR